MAISFVMIPNFVWIVDKCTLIQGYLLTVCATSKTEHEPQSGENLSAELDGCTVQLRRVVA